MKIYQQFNSRKNVVPMVNSSEYSCPSSADRNLNSNRNCKDLIAVYVSPTQIDAYGHFDSQLKSARTNDAKYPRLPIKKLEFEMIKSNKSPYERISQKIRNFYKLRESNIKKEKIRKIISQGVLNSTTNSLPNYSHTSTINPKKKGEQPQPKSELKLAPSQIGHLKPVQERGRKIVPNSRIEKPTRIKTQESESPRPHKSQENFTKPHAPQSSQEKDQHSNRVFLKKAKTTHNHKQALSQHDFIISNNSFLTQGQQDLQRKTNTKIYANQKIHHHQYSGGSMGSAGFGAPAQRIITGRVSECLKKELKRTLHNIKLPIFTHMFSDYRKQTPDPVLSHNAVFGNDCASFASSPSSAAKYGLKERNASYSHSARHANLHCCNLNAQPKYLVQEKQNAPFPMFKIEVRGKTPEPYVGDKRMYSASNQSANYYSNSLGNNSRRNNKRGKKSKRRSNNIHYVPNVMNLNNEALQNMKGMVCFNNEPCFNPRCNYTAPEPFPKKNSLHEDGSLNRLFSKMSSFDEKAQLANPPQTAIPEILNSSELMNGKENDFENENPFAPARELEEKEVFPKQEKNCEKCRNHSENNIFFRKRKQKCNRCAFLNSHRLEGRSGYSVGQGITMIDPSPDLSEPKSKAHHSPKNSKNPKSKEEHPSQITAFRKDISYWKSPKADIGIIMTKNDKPKELQKQERLLNVIKNEIGKQENMVRKKYMVNHPVVHLLEKNIKKIDVNEMFLNKNNFDNLKEFHQIAAEDQSAKKPKPLQAFDSMTVKQNMNLKRKIGLCAHPSSFCV